MNFRPCDLKIWKLKPYRTRDLLRGTPIVSTAEYIKSMNGSGVKGGQSCCHQS